MVEEFKVTKCRLALTYRDSRDQLTREAGIRTRQIPATFPRLPGEGVDNMADDGRSRMSRIPSSICVESIDECWTERPLEESSRSQAVRNVRESLVLALAQERVHKLEAWKRGAVTWPVTADLPNWRVLWLRIETPREVWGPPDDLSSRPRLHPLEIGVCWHHRCIIQLNSLGNQWFPGKSGWQPRKVSNAGETADLQERLAG